MRKNSGVTFVEMMIATALLAIICLGSVGAFGNIAKSIQVSKMRTIAYNLAQEQMQILKQKDFNQVLVTTSSLYVSQFGSDLKYDTGYYPPESVTEGGLTYTRYTFVEVTREDSGILNYLGPVSDTGMKAITVSVTWNQGGELKKVQLRNIFGNINTTMSNAIFTGKVQINGTSTGIPNARVTVAENVGFVDTTNGTGNYTINVYPGNYTLVATADGYFPAPQTVSVAANASQTVNFNMVAMSSGTVKGTAWINDHLVISQIVGSSATATGLHQEWVEVYNPTTWTWTSSDVGLKFQRTNTIDPSPVDISINYVTPTIAPGGFFLFANTNTISAVGSNLIADGYWNLTAGTNDTAFSPRFTATDPNIITTYNDTNAWGRASVILYRRSTNAVLDTVGWRGNGSLVPPAYESNPMNFNQGLNDSEQFYRYSSTSGFNPAYGPAYDSNDNNRDLNVLNPVGWVPHNSLSAIVQSISGTPALGAYITATDGLSQVAQATIGSPAYAEFTLTSVATGTWTVFISSGNKMLTVSTVTVVTNNVTNIPNAATVPSWPAVGTYTSNLNTSASGGFIAGWVKNVLLSPIPTSIYISAPGISPQLVNPSNGVYFLSVSTGFIDITANANNQNSFYVSMTSQTVPVVLGEVTTDVNFIISQGGRIRGSTTRDGINALTGISFIATDANSVDQGPAISGNDGQFTLINLSTGIYTVTPVLGSGESSSPSTAIATVTAGSTINVGTFTISGSFGSIRGNVSDGGYPIKTGVLIIASTSTITAPPALSVNSLTGAAYYTTNTYEDGSYVLSLRGSTVPYQVYGYYTTFTGDTPSTTSRNVSNVTVTAGGSTSGVNFSW